MRAVVAAVAIALVAPGCSVYEDENARRDARAAVETFLAACAAGRAEAALDLLTPLERATFVHAGSPREGCAEVMGLPARPEPALESAFRDADVGEVLVEGGLGTAVARLGGGASVEFDLEQAGATWHLGTTAPPERPSR